MSGFKFIDNIKQIKSQMDRNLIAALSAIGEIGKESVVKQAQTGYGNPIYKSGDLQRDVNYQVEASEPETVDVGNNVEYAPWVHDGTRRMGARPYIRDGIYNAKNAIKEIAEEQLKQGF